VIRRVILKVKKFIFKPKIRIDPASAPLVRLGTAYGGKTFVDRADLVGATIMSAGLGEDASFDVEFAARYKAIILILDPTPRSIVYYHGLTKRIGRRSEIGYGTSGCLPLESYDLSEVSAEQLVFVPKALWTTECKLKFFLPKNPLHVSHSITNFQNDYHADTDFIEVEATTIESLLRIHGITEIPLLKLDIEGAEISVIENLLETGPNPGQILVEFDELARPSRIVKSKYERLDKLLRQSGYHCVHWDGYSDYSYELCR
jgi:FkbM family methyltransferase